MRVELALAPPLHPYPLVSKHVGTADSQLDSDLTALLDTVSDLHRHVARSLERRFRHMQRFRGGRRGNFFEESAKVTAVHIVDSELPEKDVASEVDHLASALAPCMDALLKQARANADAISSSMVAEFGAWLEQQPRTGVPHLLGASFLAAASHDDQTFRIVPGDDPYPTAGGLIADLGKRHQTAVKLAATKISLMEVDLLQSLRRAMMDAMQASSPTKGTGKDV
mmetsp:Transcript_16888/g.47297  ORF Transcript_16888/g.47297 Transcript_16888/m.47297 type:complete len:225 (-) Transcript_16888:103-777(-)